MGEGVKCKSEFIAHFHGGINFALYIGVTGNKSFFIHDLYQCIQFQISANKHGYSSFLFIIFICCFQVSLVIHCPGKSIHHHLVYTHSGIGETGIALCTGTSFYIFAQCKFYKRIGTGKFHILVVGTPA